MTRPVHVLSVVAALGFGGDENRLLSMVRSIDRAKFRFSVALLPQVEGYDRDAGSIRPALEAADVPVYEIDNPRSPIWLPRHVRGAFRLAGKVRSVAQLVRRLSIDLVDARLDGGMLVGIPAAALSGRPSVATLYDAAPWTPYPLWRVIRATTINLSGALVTDSAARRVQLERWIWLRKPRAWTIPNGIVAPIATRSAASIREELGLPDARASRIICQIAGIVPYKGHMVLLDAAQRVVREEPTAFFLLVGYCRGHHAYQKELMDRVHALGLQQHVRIAPYAGPIGDVWQVVDIHVHASLFDSLPNAILEGMSLGKPAAVTAVGGIAEAIEHEVSGLVVAPNESVALANALLRLLRRPDEARAFGRSAQAQFESRYRPAKMARSLEECFDAVLDTHAGIRE